MHIPNQQQWDTSYLLVLLLLIHSHPLLHCLRGIDGLQGSVEVGRALPVANPVLRPPALDSSTPEIDDDRTLHDTRILRSHPIPSLGLAPKSSSLAFVGDFSRHSWTRRSGVYFKNLPSFRSCLMEFGLRWLA